MFSTAKILFFDFSIIDLVEVEKIRRRMISYKTAGYLIFSLQDASLAIKKGASEDIIKETSKDFLKDLPEVADNAISFCRKFPDPHPKNISYNRSTSCTPPNAGLLTLMELALSELNYTPDYPSSLMVYNSRDFAVMAQSVEMNYEHYSEWIKPKPIFITPKNVN